MRDFIYGLTRLIPPPLRGAARSIADRIFAVWDDIFKLLSRLRNPWGRLTANARAFIAELQHWGTELYLGVWWVKNVWAPGLVNQAAKVLRFWATALVEGARRVLAAAIDVLRRWAISAVNSVTAFIRNVQTWAGKLLAALTNNLSALIRNLRHVLSGPGALAQWAIAAIWSAGVRYAYAQRDKIAKWALRSSTAFTLWLGRALEDILRRIL